MSILLKNVSYLDVIKGKIIENKDILIENNIIKKIGNDINDKAETVISGYNKLAVPAYSNAHSHLGMTMMRNYADDLELNTWLNEKIWPFEAKLTDEDIYVASQMSILENIKSGVSTVCDMYYSLDYVSEAVKESGIRAVLTRGLMDIAGGGEERLEEMKNLYKDYHNYADGRVKILPGPHAIYTCSEEYLKEVIKLTKEFDGALNIHMSETIKEVEDCKKLHNGLTPVEYINELGMLDLHVIAAHCTHITDNEIQIIKDKDFYPVYNPSSNLKLASGFTPVHQMLENNIKVAIGTDGSSSNNNQNMIEEMHIASIVNKAVELNAEAVPAIKVLQMATINGSKALGFDNGIIEEGKLADISLFDLNSINFTPRNNLISALCYSASSNDVVDLIVDGKLIMKNREVLTMDEEYIKYKVNENTKRLLNR